MRMKVWSAVAWGAMLTASGPLGCAGKATDSSHAEAGSAQGGNAGAGVDGNVSGGGVAGELIGGEHGGIGGDGSTEPKWLIASAWDITVRAEYTDPTDPPVEFALSLAVLDDAGALSGILSRDGQLSTFALTRESGARAQLDAPDSGVRFSVLGQYPTTALVLDTLALSAFDDDADGVADRLEGNGDGGIEVSCGDCYYRKAASVTLSGKPDRTPPKLNVPQDLNPISQLSVTTSEALKSATLALTGSSAVALSADTAVAPLSTFSASAVLPFSGAWKITGTGKDFAGQLLDLSAAQVTTIADPGVFAQDGFESAPNAVLSGAVVVDGSSGLPIPTGDRALYLAPGSSDVSLAANGCELNGVSADGGSGQRQRGQRLAPIQHGGDRWRGARWGLLDARSRSVAHELRELDARVRGQNSATRAHRSRQRGRRADLRADLHRRRAVRRPRRATGRRLEARVSLSVSH